MMLLQQESIGTKTREGRMRGSVRGLQHLM